jgi:hypothetical protein
LRSGWFARAWREAQASAKHVDTSFPAPLEPHTRAIADPVERARRIAELHAPADMMTLIAISHGLTVEQQEVYARALRHTSDLAQRRLAMVGLRAGDALAIEPSDRLRQFLDLWHADSARDSRPPRDRARDALAAPVILDPDTVTDAVTDVDPARPAAPPPRARARPAARPPRRTGA